MILIQEFRYAPWAVLKTTGICVPRVPVATLGTTWGWHYLERARCSQELLPNAPTLPPCQQVSLVRLRNTESNILKKEKSSSRIISPWQNRGGCWATQKSALFGGNDIALLYSVSSTVTQPQPCLSSMLWSCPMCSPSLSPFLMSTHFFFWFQLQACRLDDVLASF